MTQPMAMDDAAVKKPRKKKRSKAQGRNGPAGDAGATRLLRTAITVAVALLVGIGIGRALSVRS
jgi:hypothetical protein